MYALSVCFKRFKEFKVLSKKKVECNIKVLHLDSSQEYISKSFKEYLMMQGIVLQINVFLEQKIALKRFSL